MNGLAVFVSILFPCSFFVSKDVNCSTSFNIRISVRIFVNIQACKKHGLYFKGFSVEQAKINAFTYLFSRISSETKNIQDLVRSGANNLRALLS